MVPAKNEYEYLGILVSEDLKRNRQVEKMITSCRTRTKSLIWKLTNGRKVRPRTAIYVWNTMIRPGLEYASEVWSHGLTEDQENKIESIQNLFVRKMCQLPGGTASVFREITVEVG